MTPGIGYSITGWVGEHRFPHQCGRQMLGIISSAFGRAVLLSGELIDSAGAGVPPKTLLFSPAPEHFCQTLV
jgi:hypothetical protein